MMHVKEENGNREFEVVYEVLKNEKKNDDTDAIEPKDFFWDQFIKYISSAILALTVLNVSVDFLREGGIKCFPPPDTATYFLQDNPVYEFGRDHASYVNNYCSRSVPISEYFPIYILVHGILLVAPHYIWNSVFKGDFDSFFAIAEKFDRLRSYQTGEYQQNNFDRVKKLEDEYGGMKRGIFNAYILKLLVQFLVCIGSVVFSALFFIDFSFSFDCPGGFETNNVPHGWPLNVTIPCVYTSLRILRLVRFADFFLNALAGVLALFGIGWCFVRHTHELGHIEIARFSFQACLISESFIFPPKFSWPSYPCFRAVKYKGHGPQWLRKLIWIFTHYPRIHVRNIFTPQVKNDLDFLVMRLFRADSSHGKVFKDIQINKELKSLIGRDHQLLHLYINIQSDMKTLKHEPTSEVLAQREQEENDSGDKDDGCCGCLRRLFRRRRRRTSTSGTAASSENEDDSRHDATNPMFPGEDEPDHHHYSDGDVPSPSLRGQNEGATRQNGESASLVAIAMPVSGGQGQADIDGQLAPVAQEGPYRPAMQPATRGEISDWHDLFLDSGFTIGRPERLAYHYFRPHLGNLDFREEDFRGIRDWIYWFVAMFGPKVNSTSQQHQHGAATTSALRPSNTLAIDISFGSIGYALVLARPFKRVLSINFDAFFRGRDSGKTKEVVIMDEFYTNYATVKFPHDIFTQQNYNINDVGKIISEFLGKVRGNIDFLVVGPIAEEQKRVSVNLMINMLYTMDKIRDQALLLAIRPLKVGSAKLSKHYYKYAPSKQLFDHGVQHNEIELKLKDRGIRLWPVDENKGIQFFCGKVPCVFEFSAYRYNGARIKNNSMRAVSVSNKNQNRNGSRLPPPSNDIGQPTFDQSSHQQSTHREHTDGGTEIHSSDGANFAESVDLPYESNERLHTDSVVSSETSGSSRDEIDEESFDSQENLATQWRLPSSTKTVSAKTQPGEVRSSLGAATRLATAVLAPQSVPAIADGQSLMSGGAQTAENVPALNFQSISTNLVLDKNARTASSQQPLRRAVQDRSRFMDARAQEQKPWIPMKAHHTDSHRALLDKFPQAQPPDNQLGMMDSPTTPNNDQPIYTFPDQPKLDLAADHLTDYEIHSGVASHFSQIETLERQPTKSSPLRQKTESLEIDATANSHQSPAPDAGNQPGSESSETGHISRPRIKSQMSLNHNEIVNQVLSNQESTDSGIVFSPNAEAPGDLETKLRSVAGDSPTVPSLSGNVVVPALNEEEHNLSDSEV